MSDRPQTDVHERLLWIAVLDGVTAALFAPMLPFPLKFVPDVDSQYYSIAGQRALFWVQTGIDGTSVVAAACGLLSLWRWPRAAGACQRVLFYALLARTAIIILELSSPSEGGVGSFLFLLALPFILALTIAAFFAARRTSRA